MIVWFNELKGIKSTYNASWWLILWAIGMFILIMFGELIGHFRRKK